MNYRGREVTVEALGQKWTLARRTLDILDDFTRWARTLLRDPLEVAEAAVERLQMRALEISQDKSLTSEIKQFKLFQNQQQQERTTRIAIETSTSYLAFESPQFQSVLRSPRGAAHMYMLLLRPNHSDMTEELAMQIAQAINPELQAEVDKQIDGTTPPAKNG